MPQLIITGVMDPAIVMGDGERQVIMQIIERGTPVKIVIHVDREAAILAGKPRWGDYVVEFDPEVLTPEQRQALVECPTAENSADRRYLPKVTCPGYTIPEATIEMIQNVLDARIKDKADCVARDAKTKTDKVERAEAELQKFLTMSVDQCLVQDYGRVADLPGYKWWTLTQEVKNLTQHYGLKLEDLRFAESVKTKLQRLEVEVSTRNEELVKVRTIEVEQRKLQIQRDDEAKAAKVQAQKDQIAQWVQDHGTENQRARMAAGMLPDDEIKRAMRDLAFKPLDKIYGRYARLDPKDVCSCDYSPCEVKFTVEDATTMTAQQWTQAEEMKKLVTGCTIKLRIHEGAAQDCHAGTRCYSYLVTVTVGEFTFSREYETPSTPEQSEED
jgi:hypothetical protein